MFRRENRTKPDLNPSDSPTEIIYRHGGSETQLLGWDTEVENRKAHVRRSAPQRPWASLPGREAQGLQSPAGGPEQ